MGYWTEGLISSRAEAGGFLPFLVMWISPLVMLQHGSWLPWERARDTPWWPYFRFSVGKLELGGGSLTIAFLTKTYQPAPISAHTASFSSLIIDEFSVFQSQVNPFSCVLSHIPCSLLKDFALIVIPSLPCIIKLSSQLITHCNNSHLRHRSHIPLSHHPFHCFL